MVRIVIVNDGTVRNCEEGASLLAELLRAEHLWITHAMEQVYVENAKCEL